MSYYLFATTLAVGFIIAAVCRLKQNKKNNQNTQYDEQQKIKMLREERKLRWYNSLSDEERQKIDVQTRFADELLNNTRTLVGLKYNKMNKSESEVDKLCNDHYCIFRPNKVNNSALCYTAVVKCGERKISGIVENNIVTKFEVHDVCVF